MTDMQLAMEKVQASIKELANALASSASAESENPNEESLGEFLDEITKNNMFL